MRSHKLISLTAATVLLSGAGAVATAMPAHALRQCISYTIIENYGITSGPSVYVEDTWQCDSAPFSVPQAVSIFKYVGGVGWEAVARGSGYISYACTGGKFLYTTSVTEAEGNPAFYCG